MKKKRVYARIQRSISERTLESAKTYLATFAEDRCFFEHSDGHTVIHFVAKADLDLFNRQFPGLIEQIGRPS
ncbi:MAG: hypothetical protein WD711_04560 [Dongiaceae bacterium]